MMYNNYGSGNQRQNRGQQRRQRTFTPPESSSSGFSFSEEDTGLRSLLDPAQGNDEFSVLNKHKLGKTVGGKFGRKMGDKVKGRQGGRFIPDKDSRQRGYLFDLEKELGRVDSEVRRASKAEYEEKLGIYEKQKEQVGEYDTLAELARTNEQSNLAESNSAVDEARNQLQGVQDTNAAGTKKLEGAIGEREKKTEAMWAKTQKQLSEQKALTEQSFQDQFDTIAQTAASQKEMLAMENSEVDRRLASQMGGVGITQEQRQQFQFQAGEQKRKAANRVNGVFGQMMTQAHQAQGSSRQAWGQILGQVGTAQSGQATNLYSQSVSELNQNIQNSANRESTMRSTITNLSESARTSRIAIRAASEQAQFTASQLKQAGLSNLAAAVPEFPVISGAETIQTLLTAVSQYGDWTNSQTDARFGPEYGFNEGSATPWSTTFRTPFYTGEGGMPKPGQEVTYHNGGNSPNQPGPGGSFSRIGNDYRRAPFAGPRDAIPQYHTYG